MAERLEIRRINNLRIYLLLVWQLPIIICLPVFYIYKEMLSWPFAVIFHQVLPLIYLAEGVATFTIFVAVEIMLGPFFGRYRSFIPDYRPVSELVDLLFRGALLAFTYLLIGLAAASFAYFRALVDFQWEIFSHYKLVLLVLAGAIVVLDLVAVFVFFYWIKMNRGVDRATFQTWFDDVFPRLPLQFAVVAIITYLFVVYVPTVYVYLSVSNDTVTLLFIFALTCFVLPFFPLYYFLFRWVVTVFVEDISELLVEEDAGTGSL